MSTKLFCDRCGDEHGEGKASRVQECLLSVDNAVVKKLDLCGACIEQVIDGLKPQARAYRADR